MLCGGFSAEVRAKKMRQDGCTEFISASLGGGIAHISPLCYTESEIPAALRAVGHTAAFRTQCRRERGGKYIRAAKRHIELGTARHPAARDISKPYPRKGTETPCRRRAGGAPHMRISKPYPRKGTETSSRDNPPLSVSYFKTISPQGDGNIQPPHEPCLQSHFKTISPQGDGTHAPSQSAKQKSSHIFSGCSFRVLSLMRFSLPANIVKKMA